MRIHPERCRTDHDTDPFARCPLRTQLPDRLSTPETPDMLARSLATVACGLLLAGVSAATPPKPSIQDGAREAKPDGRATPARPTDDIRMQNAMALRGGVSEDMWLESLHRLTRVPSPRREQVTRLVRTYIVTATEWRETQAPEMKRLTEILVAARKSGEQPPVEVSTKIREIRRAMPRLSTLQEQVWQVLSSPEQVRLVEEITALKKTGLPKDVTEGRRPAGSPAVVTHQAAADESSETPEKPAPALWSFVDDPNAGEPLPEPTLETEARDSSPKEG
jgi:hypothetical protein